MFFSAMQVSFGARQLLFNGDLRNGLDYSISKGCVGFTAKDGTNPAASSRYTASSRSLIKLSYSSVADRSLHLHTFDLISDLLSLSVHNL